MDIPVNIAIYQFSDEEIETIQTYRDNQPDGRLKSRFIALLLIARGDNPLEAAKIVGKSPATIERWFDNYIKNGIDSLNSFGYKPKKSFLSEDQVLQLIQWVKETSPPNLKAVKTYIQEQFNIIYTVPAVHKILKKKGLSICDQN